MYDTRFLHSPLHRPIFPLNSVYPRICISVFESVYFHKGQSVSLLRKFALITHTPTVYSSCQIGSSYTSSPAIDTRLQARKDTYFSVRRAVVSQSFWLLFRA